MRKILMLLFLAVGVCSADSIYIDFTSSDFDGATGQKTFTTEFTTGHSITLTALPNTVLWNRKLNKSADGIGIGPCDAPEIGYSCFAGDEFLQVSFTPPGSLGSFTVGKLFWTGLDREKGAYQLNGSGGWTEFDGQGSTGGVSTIDLPAGSPVNSIKFDAVGLASDFTLKGMTVSVPDGGMTLMLLGGALVGLETLRRKYRV